jgi:hypothetical protein
MQHLTAKKRWKGKTNISKSKCPQNNKKKGEYGVPRDKVGLPRPP